MSVYAKPKFDGDGYLYALLEVIYLNDYEELKKRFKTICYADCDRSYLGAYYYATRLNKKDKHLALTPLQYAAKIGNKEIIDFLLSWLARIEIEEDRYKP